MAPRIVGANIDTFIGDARLNGAFPDGLADQLEDLKRRSQEAEEDLPAPWQFAGETLFIKPHGAGRQWRWILHSPSIHVDVGLGKLTHIVAKARLSSAFLWEHEIGTALTLLYSFLAEFLQVPFTLQVSEVHLCADVAGWDLSLEEMSAFITRSRSKGLRLGSEAADEALDASLEARGPFTTPGDVRVQFAGRRLATLDFSKALHMPAVSTIRPLRSPSRARTGRTRSGRRTAGTVKPESRGWSSVTNASASAR
jgi:hypothetical protein